MSSIATIAAVTAALRNLILNAIQTNDQLTGSKLTSMPPDKARGSQTGNQLNLFLYHLEPSAAFRNHPEPLRTRSGETGHPSLALNLHYLLSGYGQGDDDIPAHHLLGLAMSVLHDHPELTGAELRQAMPPAEDGDSLPIERIRIRLQPLSPEEMYKLWSAYQTGYRISAAYEVSVVLIDTQRALKAPLPALGFGPEGLLTHAGALLPFPTIDSLVYPKRQASALLGDKVTVRGHHLGEASPQPGDKVEVMLMHPLWTGPKHLPVAGTPEELEFTLPADEPGEWPVGLYRLTVVFTPLGKPPRVSSELPLSLAPKLTSMTVSGAPPESLQLSFTPELWPQQRASLLLGSQELSAPPPSSKTGSLQLGIQGIPSGTYYVRLRVEGVDSLLVDRSGPVPIFDPSQKVTLP